MVTVYEPSLGAVLTQPDCSTSDTVYVPGARLSKRYDPSWAVATSLCSGPERVIFQSAIPGSPSLAPFPSRSLYFMPDMLNEEILLTKFMPVASSPASSTVREPLSGLTAFQPEGSSSLRVYVPASSCSNL